MASRTAVESRALWDSPTARLTAVAASVRDQHTVAFLGDSKGNLHKVEQSLNLLKDVCVEQSMSGPRSHI